MIRPNQIPDEVVEAAAKALKDHPLVPFTEDAALVIARASIAAVLSAWPGVTTTSWFENSVRKAVLNIPLLQEVSDE